MSSLSSRGFALSVLLVASVLAGCAGVPPSRTPSRPGEPAAPSLGFFSRIKVPGGHEPMLRLAAKGVQIFRCEVIEGEHLWRFRQPEAELVDETGQLVARHGANFSFEHRDGSRLVTTIVDHDEASRRDDLRWLLMSAKPFGKGVFTGVTHVQRVNTVGGMPPANCSAGEVNRLLRVNFSADFIFYRARS